MIPTHRMNGGVSYRHEVSPQVHNSPYNETPHDRYPTSSPTYPLSVRVNGTVPSNRLNVSTLSKHSLSGSSASPGNSGTTGTSNTRTTQLDQSRDQSSHVTDISHLSHISHMSPIPTADMSRISHVGKNTTGSGILPRWASCRRTIFRNNNSSALTSLGMLCLTSLILALLALTFLVELDVNPDPESSVIFTEFDGTVREVTLALSVLTLSLDLSCLLICAGQFIFALKLLKNANGDARLTKYLEQLSASRVFAIGAFFISIPTFLTAVILYTFSHFQKTPAILTAIFIGFGIVVCGCAMVHNVYVWQKEKTKANKQKNIQISNQRQPNGHSPPQMSSPLPNASIDLSGTIPVAELSTLV